MNRSFVLAVMAIALLGVCRGSMADPMYFEAFLDGPSEAPPNASPGTGYSLVILDLDTNFLRIQTQFQDLIGTTTVAHIHAPTADPFEGAIGVAVSPGTLPGFPAGVTSGSYDQTFDLGSASIYTASFLNTHGGGTAAGAAAALAQFLAEGRAYFNIHTTFAPGGEIRGFYSVVPEPSGLVLTALGASGVAVGLARSRRKAGA
jgi:hypothetical protein